MALPKGKKNTETKDTTQDARVYEIEVTRAKVIKESIAFDMIVNGITIYGCWLREGKEDKNFISFPSYKGSNGSYYNHVWFKISDDMQAEIEKQIEKKLD